MSLDVPWLPIPTPLDPGEELPGSLDPLGTLAHAERLAEALLPGFTARMWRARLLTVATITSAVADRAVVLMSGREDLRLDARLAFERLFVSAVVRMVDRDPANYQGASRRLPGNELAKTAWLSSEPLTRANFLIGQAVNGPFGVIARLARQLELIDDEGRTGRNATSLLMAWSDDEQLPGFFDEPGATSRAGAAWMTDAVKQTAASTGARDWPGHFSRIWDQLARHLRPDRIGRRERVTLLRFLQGAPVRRRVFELLKEQVDIYIQVSADVRGSIERQVLLSGIKPKLMDDANDRLIAAVIDAIDSYERSTGLLQQAFDGIVWGLKQRGGRSRPDVLLADPRLRRHLEKTAAALSKFVPVLEGVARGLRDQPLVNSTQLVEPIARLREDVVEASVSASVLADAILRRHERIQKGKSKPPWIERDSFWTLMPGENRVDGESPPIWQDKYLHPFKIPNAYSMLSDLREVTIEGRDGAS